MSYPDWVLKYRATNREIRHIKGHYYVYQLKNTWDRERKRHRKVTERYIGKITPDGLIEPKHSLLMRKMEQISVKEYGASRLMMEVSQDIREALRDNFSEWREMFVFACMRAIHVTTIKNLELHYHESYISEEMKGVSTYPRHIGEMLRSIGMDRAATASFLKTFLAKSRYMAIDLTHVISLSDNIISAVLGHDPDEKHLPMVELLLLFNLEEHEPSYFRVLIGSITSVMSIAATADESGLSNVVFVADTGFIPPVTWTLWKKGEFTTSSP